jgi:hypothetical protein
MPPAMIANRPSGPGAPASYDAASEATRPTRNYYESYLQPQIGANRPMTLGDRASEPAQRRTDSAQDSRVEYVSRAGLSGQPAAVRLPGHLSQHRRPKHLSEHGLFQRLFDRQQPEHLSDGGLAAGGFSCGRGVGTRVRNGWFGPVFRARRGAIRGRD